MFTNKLRKIASKIVMLSMLFSVATPLTGFVSAAPNTDSLEVSFNHADGGYLVKDIFNQVVADRDAGDCQINGGYFVCDDDFQKGGYTVEFKDVADYTTPDPVDVTLDGGGVQVVGTYEVFGEQETENLTVGVNHPDGGFVIKNIFSEVVVSRTASDCQLNGGYYTCDEDLVQGGYTVEFTDVDGYVTPNPVDITLNQGGSVFGAYVLQQNNTATLNVAVNHNEGGFVIKNIFDEVVVSRDATDCGALQPNNYYICEEDLQKGGYTVEFTDVDGYLTPDPVDVTLENGGTVWGTYITDPETNFATLNVAVNIDDPAGFVIKNIFDEVVVDRDASDCNFQGGWYTCEVDLQKGGYTVEFKDVADYITPSDVDVTLNTGGTVWGFYSSVPAGVVEVKVVNENNVPILDLPANEWQLQECASPNPQSCYATTGSGGQADVFADQPFANYRIHFPNPEPPAGYASRTVLPSIEQDLDAEHTYILFTIKYTTDEGGPSNDVAFVNVQTTPVSAQTRMVTLDPPQADQMEVTTNQINATLYDLEPNYYTLPTGNGGVTAPTDYYIECLPAPGGYEAPANPIQVNDAVYAMQTVNLAGVCTYTDVPDNEKVTIYIDTVGVTDAEIRVDNVVVRDKGDDNIVPVEITITEDHTINWTDENGYITPVDIELPADTLDPNMTQQELTFLGYYVPIGNLAVAEVNTENENGWVYINIGNDPTMWNVGYADTTATPLVVHFDETVNHKFHFEDKNNDNPAFYLRAVPAVPGDGFTVQQNIQQNGNNVTYFQENYLYSAPQDIDVVQLVGDYIAESDAAFFRAKTTNANPVFGEIYLDINGDPTETLVPGANTFTRIFISDVVNDQDTTSFESPIDVQNCNWTANPESYDLSDYNPSPTINDLLSTYECGVDEYDIVVQLISLDNPIVLPVGDVVMDGNENATVVDNNGTPEAGFNDVDETQEHNIVCPVIGGLQVPNAIHIPENTLQPGTNTFHCLYAPQGTSAEILIETEAVDDVDFDAPITMNVDGQVYNVGWTNDAVNGVPATLPLWVDTTVSNTIIYGDMPPYITPANAVIPANTLVPGSSYQDQQYADSNTFNGFYDLPQPGGAELIFHLRELDPNDGVVPNTDVNLNGNIQQTNGNGDTTFQDVAVNQAITVTFGDHPQGPAFFTTPLPLNFQANELQDGASYEFYIWYVPPNFAVTLNVETLDEPTQLINVNGAINLIVNNGQPTLYGFGTAQIIVSNDPQFDYLIDWGPTNPASQYIEPAVDPLNVDPSGLNAGQTMDIDGLYRLCQSGNCEQVTINALDTNNNPVNADIFVNGQLEGNTSVTLTIDVGSLLNIQFEDLPSYDVPEIFHNNVSQGNSHTTQYTVLDNQQNLVEAVYPQDQNSVGFNVSTRDEDGTALSENIMHGPNGNENTVATPTSFAVDQNDLNSYTINFDDKPGYITPDPVVITNGQINLLPEHVLISLNGVPYVQGTPLDLGQTYDIVGTYIPFFQIEKSIVSEQTIVNNNKRVDYEIVVTRHPDANGGPMSITLHDTISDNNRTLFGSNGGTMSVVPQNNSYSNCSNGCGDITAGSVVVTIDNPGNSVTITYQLLSDNSGIPANSSSLFTNTLTGTFSDNGQQVQVTANASVVVSAAPSVPPCVGYGCGQPNPGGGGGGGGGGQILITGDMVLEITKMVSLDRVNWYDASDPDSPLNIPKRVDSKLYNRVTVKNLGQVTATDIIFTEDFDQLDSLITSDDIQNVQGDDGISFEDATNTLTIDEIFVGAEKEFTYEQILHEGGANGELAEEYLVLESFDTKLSSSQDGLTKHGVGEHYSSWLIAGTTTVVTDNESPLELSIRTDKAAASPGEEVTYTITAKNNADFDFTGMIVSWDYAEDCLEILNPFGGRDTGTEIHWDRGILRPGESVQYQVRTRVKQCSVPNNKIRTTARGLVNELENPAAVEHFLTLIAGIIDVPKLAQTGLGNTALLLLASILAYFGYTRTGNRRYLALKRKALRPL